MRVHAYAAIAAAWALSGCATVINDASQAVLIETLAPDGQAVNGAHCSVGGQGETGAARSGGTVSLRRGSQDLDILCKDPAQPDARGRLISRANAAMAGNIILGGLIGVVIDHAKGTGYSYPSWVQLVFGRSLVFDRGDEETGRPLKGKDPVRADDRQPNGNTRRTNWELQQW